MSVEICSYLNNRTISLLIKIYVTFVTRYPQPCRRSIVSLQTRKSVYTFSGLTLLSDSVEAFMLFTHLLCRGSETAPSSTLDYHSNNQNGACFQTNNRSVSQGEEEGSISHKDLTLSLPWSPDVCLTLSNPHVWYARNEKFPQRSFKFN